MLVFLNGEDGRQRGNESSLGATASGRYGGSAALSGGSFNSNFNTHRREYAVAMRNTERGQEVRSC